MVLNTILDGTQKFDEIVKTPVEKTYWKIEQIISNWNFNVLAQRVNELGDKVSELTSQLSFK